MRFRIQNKEASDDFLQRASDQGHVITAEIGHVPGAGTVNVAWIDSANGDRFELKWECVDGPQVD